MTGEEFISEMIRRGWLDDDVHSVNASFTTRTKRSPGETKKEPVKKEPIKNTRSSKTLEPTQPRQRDLVFDAIAVHGFSIQDLSSVNGDGGRVAKISSWLKKHETDITPVRVVAFYQWWAREHDGINPPRDLTKFQEHWAAFETAGAAKDIDGYTSRKRI